MLINVASSTIFLVWLSWAIVQQSNHHYRLIGLVGRVFANGPGDQGSFPGRDIPKTLKMVLDTALLNTQQYKVRTEGKVEQSSDSSCALPNTLL